MVDNHPANTNNPISTAVFSDEVFFKLVITEAPPAVVSVGSNLGGDRVTGPLLDRTIVVAEHETRTIQITTQDPGHSSSAPYAIAYGSLTHTTLADKGILTLGSSVGGLGTHWSSDLTVEALPLPANVLEEVHQVTLRAHKIDDATLYKEINFNIKRISKMGA